MTTQEKIEKFENACNRAADYANRHNGGLERAEKFLARAGFGAQFFGVEYVECAGRELAYLNTGETYNLTVCQEGAEVFAGSWGGWMEETENQHCEDNNEIRCGYCGEFTECAEDWHATVCQHCGRYVDSGEKPEGE